MQLETLKMFCAVVETGSFSQAARLSHVTQSAVSQQVRTLEERYGQELLHRSARSTTPTPMGERLYRGCRELLSRFDDLEREVRTGSAEVLGTCNVSTIYSVGLHELQPFVKRVLVEHPQLDVRLNYRRSAQVYEEVANGLCDVGIVAYPAAQPGLTIVPFQEDSLALVLPPAHPLCAKQKVPLKSLAGLEFIAFDRDAPTRKAIDRVLRSAGVEIRPRQELDNVETIKQAVELGMGVSILPRAAVQREVAAGLLAMRPFADGTFTRPLGLVLRKDRFLTRAASAVLEALTRAPL
jgi:DNA-binding transcriptional LysR family regulator